MVKCIHRDICNIYGGTFSKSLLKYKLEKLQDGGMVWRGCTDEDKSCRHRKLHYGRVFMLNKDYQSMIYE